MIEFIIYQKSLIYLPINILYSSSYGYSFNYILFIIVSICNFTDFLLFCKNKNHIWLVPFTGNVRNSLRVQLQFFNQVFSSSSMELIFSLLCRCRIASGHGSSRNSIINFRVYSTNINISSYSFLQKFSLMNLNFWKNFWAT